MTELYLVIVYFYFDLINTHLLHETLKLYIILVFNKTILI